MNHLSLFVTKKNNEHVIRRESSKPGRGDKDVCVPKGYFPDYIKMAMAYEMSLIKSPEMTLMLDVIDDASSVRERTHHLVTKQDDGSLSFEGREDVSYNSQKELIFSNIASVSRNPNNVVVSYPKGISEIESLFDVKIVESIAIPVRYEFGQEAVDTQNSAINNALIKFKASKVMIPLRGILPVGNAGVILAGNKPKILGEQNSLTNNIPLQQQSILQIGQAGSFNVVSRFNNALKKTAFIKSALISNHDREFKLKPNNTDTPIYSLESVGFLSDESLGAAVNDMRSHYLKFMASKFPGDNLFDKFYNDVINARESELPDLMEQYAVAMGAPINEITQKASVGMAEMIQGFYLVMPDDMTDDVLKIQMKKMFHDIENNFKAIGVDEPSEIIRPRP